MKRIYITLAILLIGMIGMAYLYFSNLKIETSVNDLSLNSATANSGIIFSFDNDKSFYEILAGQELFQYILGETKSKQLSALKNNLIDLPSIANLLNGQKIYISIQPTISDSIGFLISTQFKPDTKLKNLLNGLNNGKIKTNKIKDYYQLTFADSSICYIGIKGMLVIVSDNTTTIESGLKQEKKTDQNFINYIKANSRFNKNTLANLYIDFNKLPSLLKNVLNSNLNGELSLFSQQNSFAALSYNFSKEKLLFNGNTEIFDNNSYFKLFSNIPEQRLTINNIIPEKTANYIIYAITDYSSWYKELSNWMAAKKESEKISKSIANINKKYGLDLNEIFPKYFKGQLVTFQLQTGEKLGAIALSNGEKVNQLLLDLSTKYAPGISIFKEDGIPYAYFGEPFKKFERPFYTIIDNYLIMANNASSVESFLNSYKSNSVLTNDIDYQNFNNQLSSSATISFYVNNKNSNDIFGRNLKSTFYKQYKSKSGFKDFDGFSYQLSGDKGKFISNLLLHKKTVKPLLTDTIKVIDN